MKARLALGALLLALAPPLHANELHWRSVEVDARLDRDGRLHVRERQAYVFTGDWNGGERRFRVAPGQSLELVRVSRVADGRAIPLVAGDLSKVDDYQRQGDTLRWRSRLPSDPSFDRTELVYDLEYALSGVVARVGDRYLFDHDFAFPDRPGVIEKFTLRFELDPAWRADGPAPLGVTTGRLVPGESVIVTRDLSFVGEGAPAAVLKTASPLVRKLAIAIVVIGIPALFAMFWLGERARGRFGRAAEPVDRAFLERHVLCHLPEVVGYMYDGKSGGPEVAAALLRLQQAGILESRVEKRFLRAPVLHMKWLDAKGELAYHEQRLLCLFFWAGRSETSTLEIRKRYAKTGFDPGKEIESDLANLAFRDPDWGDDPRVRRSDIAREYKILAAGFGLLVIGGLFGGSSLALMVYMAVFGGIACLIGRLVARRSADRMHGLALRWLGALLPVMLVARLLANVAGREVTQVRALAFLIAAVFLLVVTRFVLLGAKSPTTDARLAVRRRLHAARRWFIAQLRERNPSLEDSWAPYLLALGAGRHVDRWFSSFGGEAARGTSSAGGFSTSSAGSTFSTSSSTSGPVTTWTGGGGSFGGAGASAHWAAAVGAAAAGFSAPSTGGSGSSGGSSGSSSSSGGSSSGGGGGGGW